MNKCGHCGYEWNKRIAHPKECPKCKNRNWDKKNKEEEIDG